MASSAEKVLQLARVTSELMTRFQDREEKTAAEKAAVEATVPEAVEALVKNERIYANQKGDVATKIASSHQACIELIRDLAKHRNAGEIDQIGTQVKEASTTTHYVGSPIGDHDDRPSGQAFRNILMGAH
jgi:hypothetical protein